MVNGFLRLFMLGCSFSRMVRVLAVVLALSLPGCGDSEINRSGDSESQNKLMLPAELASELSGERRDELVELGRAAFAAKGCTACHGLNGQALTGPALAGIYGLSITLKDGRVLERDMAYLYESLVAPSQYVSSGGPVVMPPYSYLDEQTLVSLVCFVRSLSEPEAKAVHVIDGQGVSIDQQ